MPYAEGLSFRDQRYGRAEVYTPLTQAQLGVQAAHIDRDSGFAKGHLLAPAFAQNLVFLSCVSLIPAGAQAASDCGGFSFRTRSGNARLRRRDGCQRASHNLGCRSFNAWDHREDMTRAHQHPLERILESGIAIIAGVTGISIRTYGVAGADFRGERFKNSIKDLKNNGDVFSLTQLQMFCDIHRRVLEAGDVARNKRCRWSRCVSGRIMDIQ